MTYTPTYVGADLPAIGTDAVGTAGAAVVPLIPLAVTGIVLFKGTEFGVKKYKKLKKEAKKKSRKKSMSSKGWYRESYRHSLAAKGVKTRYKRW